MCVVEDEDQEQIDEILAIEEDFDTLIRNYDPCERAGKPVIRTVNNTEIFNDFINNEFYKSKIHHTFSEDDSEVTLELADDFTVDPPLFNTAF